jgi:hypothetical protein
MKQLHRPGCWLTSWLLLLLHILVLSSSSSSIAVSSSSVNDAILDAAAPPATSPNGGAGHEFGKRWQQHRPSPSQSVDIQQQHLIDAAMIMSTQATARVINHQQKKTTLFKPVRLFSRFASDHILSLSSSLKKFQHIFSSEQNAIVRGREITNLVPQVVEHFCHLLLS